jgi:hypothetical protein
MEINEERFMADLDETLAQFFKPSESYNFVLRIVENLLNQCVEVPHEG